MANRYWVGGTATWDGTAGSKWALTSGGAGGQAVPTTSDTVLFDANSGASTVTIGSGVATCSTLTMTGFTGTLAFGSNSITCAGTGTIYTGATTFSVTGTPLIICNNSSATARTISPTATTEANAISFNITAGNGSVSLTAGSYLNLNFTGFTGTLTNTGRTIYGSLTLGSGMTVTDGVLGTTFSATLVQQNITNNGVAFNVPITMTGTQTVQLQDALTLASARTFTLTNGTLDLNSKTLTCGLFSSSNSNTRSILFGTGNITLTGSNATIWGFAVATGFTYTGIPKVNCTYSGSTGTRTISQSTGANESNSVDFYITAGTDIFATSSNMYIGTLDFTGFTGTFTRNATTLVLYRNIVLNTGMSYTALTSSLNFSATIVSKQNITSNGVLLASPITFNGTAIYQLQDALTTNNISTVTLTTGTLDLNSKTLTCGLFSSATSNIRSILFGTGNITVTGSNATIWNTAATTNFSYTGTSAVNFTYSGSTGTRTIAQAGLANGGQESTALNMNISAGSDTVTFGGSGRIYKNLDFTGFTGTYTNTQVTFVGNVNFSSGMTVGSGTSPVTLGATSGTQQITTNGQTLNFPLTLAGTATYQLQDNFTIGATSALTFNSGTLDFNGKTFSGLTTLTITGGTAGLANGTLSIPITQTTGNVTIYGNMSTTTYTLTAGTLNLNSYNLTCTNQFLTNNSNVRSINFASFGNIVLPNSGTVWDATVGTNLTSSGSGSISLTSASSKTFIGGNGFYPSISQDGVGTLNITGSNTFTNITNTVQPTTVTFPASTITYVNNFSLTGTSGNLVTINSSVPGTQFTLNNISNSVPFSLDYLNIQDSNAVPVYWYAGDNSIDSGDNTGWIFSSSPASNKSNFFLVL